jgi:hypothetical protein
MAAFNPEVQRNGSTSYTGLSERSSGNRGFETLFSGIADAVKQKKQSDLQDLQGDINNSVNSLAEQGMGGETPDASLFDQPAQQRSGGSDGRDIPPEISDGARKLANLRESFAQNKTSDLYFNTNVARLSKSLRAKYPQFGKEIDAMVSSAIGTSTANDVRRSINSIFEQEQAAASSEETRKIALLKDYDAYLTDPEFQTDYKKITGETFNPNNFSEKAMVYAVSVQENDKRQIEKRKSQIELLNAEDVRDQKLAKSLAIQDATLLRDKLLYTTLNSDHGTKGTQFTQLQDMINTAMADRKVTPEEKAGIEAIMGPLEIQLNTAADQMLTQMDKQGRSYASVIKNGTDQQEVKDIVLSPFKSVKDALTNEHYGTLGAIKRDVEARRSYADNAFLQRDGGLTKQLETAKTIFGATRVEDVMTKLSQDPKLMSEEEKAVASKITAMLFSGESFTETLRSAAKEGGVTKAATAFNPLQAYVTALSDPGTSKDQAEKTALNLFGEKENTMLKEFSKENPDKLFSLLTNPALVDKLKGTKAGEEQYRWARWQSKVLLQPLADQLNDTQRYSDLSAIKFNPKSNRFEMSTLSGQPFIPTNPLEIMKERQGTAALQKMNSYLDQMEPILKSNGDTMDVFLNEIFIGKEYKSLQKEGSIFTRMGRSFYEGLRDVMSSDKPSKNPSGAEEFFKKPKEVEGSLPSDGTVQYANRGATRNKPVTSELEQKLATAVSTVFGDGYKAQIFSGGQDKKGHGHRRTGTIRHDGGQAADVYIIGPNGKRVTDTRALEKLKKYWLANDMGSVGTYMKGAGMHLDEWTKEELLAGMASAWRY